MRDLVRRSFTAGVLGASVLLAASCSSSTQSSSPTTPAPGGTTRSYGVGQLTESFVDAGRSTGTGPADSAPAGRALPTVVLYPAAGSPATGEQQHATPDLSGAPYPLIVFAHGLGSAGTEYRPLLDRWAAAGYVVAAPQFPLTHSGTPGGIDPGDYVHQPEDMSYVITAVLAAAAESHGPLAGLIDPDRVGAAGHSLGGITTLGLAANSCCHDRRVRAAIVMSGDTLSFPDGTFDSSLAPPLLFVHGTADPLVPYEASVDAYNRALGPKGLLTIEGGDHGSPVDPKGPAFAAVVRATTDFLDVYLAGNATATGRFRRDAVKGKTRIAFDAKAGSRTTLPTTPAPAAGDRRADATNTTDLHGGDKVTIHWSGFTPGKTVNVVECSTSAGADAAACDLKHGALLQADPTGTGQATIEIVTGAVGNGVCDATHHDCVVVVNDGGSLDPAASIRIPLTFAAG